MIDIHCHILPEMDDGPVSYDESFEMIKNAKNHKINVVIATPHFTDYSAIEDFVFERNEKAILLNEMIKSFDMDITVGCGSELYLNSEVFTAGDLDELTINGSKYMLCEYTLNKFDTQKAVIYAEELCRRGYTPIIAHPERYISFLEQPDVVNELWDMGCRFQVNASGLAGHGGLAMQEFSKDLILKGFVDFIATDAHSPKNRNNKILEKIDEFPEEISEDSIEYMLETAPLKVIKKERLEARKVDYF